MGSFMIHINQVVDKIKRKLGLERGSVAKNTHCERFEVDNWVVSEFIIKKLAAVAGTHPFPVNELQLMVSAVCRFKPQQVFEWGTNIGKSARIFYETGKWFDIPLVVHSIDLPDDHEHQEHPGSKRGKMVRGYSNVMLYQGDGLDKSIELYKRNSELRTLVFIDGDHSYESVRRELAGVIDVMPNAVILLHDTFYQSEESGYNIGPHKAATELMELYSGKYKRVNTQLGLPGMTMLFPVNLLQSDLE